MSPSSFYAALWLSDNLLPSESTRGGNLPTAEGRVGELSWMAAPVEDFLMRPPPPVFSLDAPAVESLEMPFCDD